MKSKIIYLAVPYAHPEYSVMFQRYQAVSKAATILTGAGYLVFSPITHAHPIASKITREKGWDFWQQIDLPILQICGLLLIIKLPGWEQSKGVAGEVAAAERFNITEMWIEEFEIEEVANLVSSWDYLGQFK